MGQANQKRFGENVRKRRDELGLSQEDLAHGSGLHTTAISMLERGRRQPRLETIVAVGFALKMNPGDLLDGMKPR